MLKNKLTWMVMFFIVANDTADTISQLLMKKGLGHTVAGSFNPHELGRILFQTPDSYMIWIGVLIYTLNFFLWILILSRLDLSTAVPVASTNYVLLPILAGAFLHEKISLMRWLGVLSIIVGIHFIYKSTCQASNNTGLKKL